MKRHRRVNFFENTSDFKTALLASLGFSTLYIKQNTNLSESQITYRLKKAQIRRAEYRNGESLAAAFVLEHTKPLRTNLLRDFKTFPYGHQNNKGGRKK